MHEITVISIDIVIGDRTAGDVDSPCYRMPMKFNIFASATETAKHTAIHAHMHTYKHTYMQSCAKMGENDWFF